MDEKKYYLLIDKYNNKLIDREMFEDEIGSMTHDLETPLKEFYCLFCYLQRYLYVPKGKRNYLFENVDKIIKSDLFSEDQKNIIKCATMNAYFSNYEYFSAEKYAKDLLDRCSDKNILLDLADYYTKTRRYDIAGRLYNILLENPTDNITNSYKTYHRIVDGSRKPYVPLGIENKNKYVDFINSLNIDVKIKKRTVQPDKISIKDYPKPIEIFDAGFKDFVAFDLETTGVDPSRDAIIEIGAIKVVDGKIVDSKEFIFQELVHPYKKKISKTVADLTGITNEMVYDAKEIWDVFLEFAEFVGDNILLGYNCMAFDSKFLVRAGRLSNLIITNPYFDVMHYVVKMKLKLNYENKKLNTIANQFEITNENAHRALSDAITTAKVYLKLLELEK